MLSLDEILDLHGCKYDAIIIANIEHFIYLHHMQMSNTLILPSHLTKSKHIYSLFALTSKYDLNLHHIYSIVNQMLTPALPHLLYVHFKAVTFDNYKNERSKS